MSDVIIGIDLGTSNSCVAAKINGKIEIIQDQNGKRLTPSYVTFTEDQILVGRLAKAAAQKYPKTAFYEFKRLIGQQYDEPKVLEDIKQFFYDVFDDMNVPKIRFTFKNEIIEYYPEEFSSLILEHMRKIASNRLNQEVNRAVVTIPAYFNDSQRQATLDAGAIAGFKEVTLINEPTAAALAYTYENSKTFSGNVLVYDFGGGTFDVSIVKIKDGVCKVQATDGDVHLGGTDIDLKVSNYIKKEQPELFPERTKADTNDVMRRIKSKCEFVKKRLSESNSARFEINRVYEDKDIDKTISKICFEHLIKEVVQKTIYIMDNCIKASGLSKDNIDEVLLVGGSSRIDLVRRMIKDYFGGKHLNETLNPDEAIAYGAAVYAANLNAEREIIEDITSLSLGTDVRQDEMSVIIPRNTPIPTQRSKKFCTTFEDQEMMNFPIFQGEDPKASLNHKLGEFTMTGLSPGPAGSIIVTVFYDMNKEGILKVTAFESNTENNNKKEIQINTNRTGLNEKQIQEKKEAFAEYRHGNDISEFEQKKGEFQEMCKVLLEEALEKAEDPDGIEMMREEYQSAIYWFQNLTIEKAGKMDQKLKTLEKIFKALIV